ncbi:MAG: zf-HC2 domain-containing protein [Longimicrobiaceae bacterium]
MHEPWGCGQVAAATTDYLERALPPEVEAELDAHLRACAGCRRQLRTMRWTIDRLAAVPGERVPPGMKRRLLDALRRGQGRSAATPADASAHPA